MSRTPLLTCLSKEQPRTLGHDFCESWSWYCLKQAGFCTTLIVPLFMLDFSQPPGPCHCCAVDPALEPPRTSGMLHAPPGVSEGFLTPCLASTEAMNVHCDCLKLLLPINTTHHAIFSGTDKQFESHFLSHVSSLYVLMSHLLCVMGARFDKQFVHAPILGTCGVAASVGAKSGCSSSQQHSRVEGNAGPDFHALRWQALCDMRQICREDPTERHLEALCPTKSCSSPRPS